MFQIGIFNINLQSSKENLQLGTPLCYTIEIVNNLT